MSENRVEETEMSRERAERFLETPETAGRVVQHAAKFDDEKDEKSEKSEKN